jgi:hypothetical protein
MADKRDPSIVALESVHAALKDLDGPSRKKVLSSVFALLDIDGALPLANPVRHAETRQPSAGPHRGLVELMTEKKAGTSAQRIALFAYYREKIEARPRFARDDLKPYFAQAKIPPAANYDRDFVEAVRKGWIHEDGTESYLTTKGVEAIESDFEGERKYSISGGVGSRGGRKRTAARKKRR